MLIAIMNRILYKISTPLHVNSFNIRTHTHTHLYLYMYIHILTFLAFIDQSSPSLSSTVWFQSFHLSVMFSYPSGLFQSISAPFFSSPIRPCPSVFLIIIILFIERHIQQAVRGALQHCIAALSVIINIQVNYFLKIMRT